MMLLPVLIETLWNVKTGKLLLSAQSVNVLIETLWNVKKYYAGIGADGRMY